MRRGLARAVGRRAPGLSRWLLAAILLAAPRIAQAALAQPVVDAGASAPLDAAAAVIAAPAATGALEPPVPEPAAAPATGEAPDGREDPRENMLTALVRMVLVLAGILLLAYLLLHKGLGSLSSKLAQGRLVRVVDRIGLEAHKSLYVVEIAGRYYLIGTTDHGVSCLATLDAETDRAAFADALRAQRNAKASSRSDATAAAPPEAAKASSEGGHHG